MSTKHVAMSRMNLLSYVAEDCGFETVEEMLASAVCDGSCPGVCLRCHSVVETLEPDGYCECKECGSTVRSILLIAGMI
jgi:hypothetical protein